LIGIGAAYGTAKSGVAIAAVGTVNPAIVMTSLVPVIMAGILSLYGVVIAVLITTTIDMVGPYSLFASAINFGAGLGVGLCSLASGYAIGKLGDVGVRGLAKQPRLFVGLVIVLIFAEVIGIYGLILAVMANSRAKFMTC
jgi:V-type H+-transporting ATPase proteolipid subunit